MGGGHAALFVDQCTDVALAVVGDEVALVLCVVADVEESSGAAGALQGAAEVFAPEVAGRGLPGLVCPWFVFGEQVPARSAVGGIELVMSARVEIECIARAPAAK